MGGEEVRELGKRGILVLLKSHCCSVHVEEYLSMFTSV